jgi:hypothetical protein
MRFDLGEALSAIGRHLAEHPKLAVHLALGAIGQRLVVPLPALRWIAAHASRETGDPWDVELEARPPLLAVAASAHWGHADVRIRTSVRFLGIESAPGKLEARLELSDFSMEALGDAPSPMRQLLASGALDMGRPGSIFAMLSPRPAALVRAEGREVTVDLLRIQALTREPRVQKVLELVSDALQVREVWCEPEQMVARIEAIPQGLARVLDRIMAAVAPPS